MATKSVVLKNGECAVLPADAVVKSVVVDGSIVATSDCGDLPTPSAYKCYFFNWENDGAGSMQDALFQYLQVGDTKFIVPDQYQGFNNTGGIGGATLGNWINDNPTTFNGLVLFSCEQHSSDHLLKIKIPDGIGVPVLKVDNPFSSTSMSFYFYGTEDTGDCTDCV